MRSQRRSGRQCARIEGEFAHARRRATMRRILPSPLPLRHGEKQLLIVYSIYFKIFWPLDIAILDHDVRSEKSCEFFSSRYIYMYIVIN